MGGTPPFRNRVRVYMKKELHRHHEDAEMCIRDRSTQIKVTSANGKFSFCTVNVISTDARDLALAKDTYSRLMDSLYFPDTCTIYNVWVDDEAKYDRVSVYIYFSAETKGGYTLSLITI